MLKDRAQLENKLLLYVENSVTHKVKSETQEWYLELLNKYNIPIDISSNILSKRKDLSEYNDFVLFAVTDVVYHKLVKIYYTEQEIKLYSGQKYKVETFNFPIKLHLIKIDEDQYIGKTTAQSLMELRNNQLINYNADTQRALKMLLKGETVVFRPYVDNNAVKEIEESYKDKAFIPNVLTFNINEDDEKASYKYDDKTETLTIFNLTAFDIVDGYHRYLAMSRNYDKDNTFDYSMIIQITMFSVSKAKQFICQEDHKTKMKRLDSDSYDQRNTGNIVAQRLDSDTRCYLRSKINVNNGMINPGALGRVINALYFDKKSAEPIQINNATKDIRNKLNEFVEEYDEYLSRKWTTYEVITVIYGFYNNKPYDKIYDAIHNLSEKSIESLNRIGDITPRTLEILKGVL